ncbi:MAG: glycosyltransferase family 4 protein [Coraliomargaritaceae bacterium]
MNKRRRFLIISQVFPPDPTAVGQYLDEAAKDIAKSGADVTVLTANRGYDDPNSRYLSKENRDGIQIHRLPLSSFGKANLFMRIFAQLSFLIQCIIRGLFSYKTTDLLISTSPPMAAICAVVIGFFRKKLKVHYWVMDINPDQAVALGAFKIRHPFVQAMNWLNRRILRRADSVIALDRFMQNRLEQKLKDPIKELRSTIEVIPPWPIDEHLEIVPHGANPFRKDQGWQEKFVVMHSGNHSLVHPLDTLLDAAEELRNDNRFIFAFIGGGKGKGVVDGRIRKLDAQFGKNGHNIISLPYQPLEKIRYSLSAADLHIVSLGNNMSGIVHPCKIYGALRLRKPILAIGPQESYLSDILIEIDRGWSVAHGDLSGCIHAIHEAYASSQKENFTPQILKKSFQREDLISCFKNAIAH